MWINKMLNELDDFFSDVTDFWLFDGLLRITLFLFCLGFILWFFAGFAYGLLQGEILWGWRVFWLVCWGVIELCYDMKPKNHSYI